MPVRRGARDPGELGAGDRVSTASGAGIAVGMVALAAVGLSARGSGVGLGGRPGRADRNRSARWARPHDLGRLAVPDRRARGSSVSGRLVLGRMGRRTVAGERAQSVIVFGPTQSHKTSGFAIPAVLGWEGPVLAASVKTDLFEHTIAYRRSVGAVHCFDPTGSTGLESVFWSPLPAARTWPGARQGGGGHDRGGQDERRSGAGR